MMYRIYKQRRGMMMVLALLTTVVVMMFLGAALKLVPTQLAETVHSREKAAAESAARSGAAYALSRLQADVNWRANEENSVVVNLPNLRVVEDRGNVIGDLTATDGTRSQFQIRFNYGNGSNPTGSWDDQLDNPLQHHLSIDSISQNNLSGATRTPVPVPAANHQVNASSVTLEQTPRYGCVVQVVGFAGRGVTPQAASYKSNCVVAEAKVVFGREEMSRYDAVAYFGGGVVGSLAGLDGQPGVMSLNSVDARSPRLRTMGDINLAAGDLIGGTGSEVILGQSGQLLQGPNPLSSSIHAKKESPQQQKKPLA